MSEIDENEGGWARWRGRWVLGENHLSGPKDSKYDSTSLRKRREPAWLESRSDMVERGGEGPRGCVEHVGFYPWEWWRRMGKGMVWFMHDSSQTVLAGEVGRVTSGIGVSYLPDGGFRWVLAKVPAKVKRPLSVTSETHQSEMCGGGDPHKAPSITERRWNSNTGPRRIWGAGWRQKNEQNFMRQDVLGNTRQCSWDGMWWSCSGPSIGT